MTRRLAVGGALALLIAALAVPALAQPSRPSYLPYAEFATDDSNEVVTLKRGYNDAVQR